MSLGATDLSFVRSVLYFLDCSPFDRALGLPPYNALIMYPPLGIKCSDAVYQALYRGRCSEDLPESRPLSANHGTVAASFHCVGCDCCDRLPDIKPLSFGEPTPRCQPFAGRETHDRHLHSTLQSSHDCYRASFDTRYRHGHTIE